MGEWNVVNHRNSNAACGKLFKQRSSFLATLGHATRRMEDIVIYAKIYIIYIIKEKKDIRRIKIY